MPLAADKIMFEIYREADYDRLYRVVYFTELDEHNKEREIARAMAGEHVYDGFLAERGKETGKQVLQKLIDRMNAGEEQDPERIEQELAKLEVLPD